MDWVKENQLIQDHNNQGITKNYPQYGTNFWGGSSKNNYGFGSSNIHDNIENKNNNPFENTVNTFGQNQTGQSYGLGSDSQNQTKSNNIPRYWETAADGEKVLMVKKFGTTFNNKKVLSNLGVKIYLVIYIL